MQSADRTTCTVELASHTSFRIDFLRAISVTCTKLCTTFPGGRESPPAGGMSRCPFGVFPNYSLRGVPVPVFGQPDRPYIAIPSAVHDELFARMAQPLDITAKRHTPPFGRPAIPWPGKVAEMEDWTKREGFGKSPRYLADKLGSSGAFSQAGYSTCSAVGMLETLDLINLPPSCASP